MSVYMPRPEGQVHNFGAPGIAVLRSSNSSALLRLSLRLFTAIVRALVGHGEPVIQRPDFFAIEAALSNELSNGQDPSLDGCLRHAGRLVAMGSGREHAERSRLRAAVDRQIERTCSALVESAATAVARNPALGRKLAPALLQELQQDFARYSSHEVVGDALSRLTQITSRAHQFLNMEVELCTDLLERAPGALRAAIAPHIAVVERALARGALLEALPAVNERLSSELGLLENKGASFTSKIERVQHELRSRLARSEALEKQGSGGFERVLQGIGDGELSDRLKAAWKVDDKNLGDAAGERLVERLRTRLKAERPQAAEILSQSEDHAIVEELIATLSEGTGEQSIYAALIELDIEDQAAFLWNAATPSASPSALATPNLLVHTTKLNQISLPPTKDHGRIRDELVVAVRSLSDGGLDVVEARHGQSTIVLTRYVLGFPPACDPQNPVLLSAYVQGIENGHWPSLAGERPDNPGDAGALELWRRRTQRS